MKKIRVADLMTRDLIFVKPDTNLLECAKTMVRNRLGSLPIVSNKRLVGYLSYQDILWALTKKPKDDMRNINAIDISPKKLATVKPTYHIGMAIDKMKKLKFERLPVIDKGELVGIITSRDILTFHPEIYPEFEEIETIREEAEKLKRYKKAISENNGKLLIEGVCEECGAVDFLSDFNGMLICESCRNSM